MKVFVKSAITIISFLMVTGAVFCQVTSGNPIIRHIRSADPSARVWEDGKIWVYASHDQDNATDYSTMDGYHVFSSYDLVNWTDHGEILHSRDVSWGIPQGGFMFAPDAAYKNGTYYLYFPHLASSGGWRVGVATSEKPEGPFTDVGHFIEGTNEIDPACFVDEDGQAYLIWGGGANGPYMARLKENMTELAEEPRIIEYGAINFGEGPYMHKRNGIYYFSYTCNTCYPYQGYYATGDNPYGPFEYRGELNLSPPGAQDHHSMIEYHGQWYYFYHVGNYNGGSLYRRNVCVDSLFYNEDGTMRIVVQTKTGVGQDTIGMTPGILTPGRIEAENFFRQKGIDSLNLGDSATVVTQIESSDWFDFVLEVLGTEVYKAEIKVHDPVPGTKIFLLVDELIEDSITVETSTDTLEAFIALNKGKHTLKLLFSNGETDTSLMDIDWIELQGEKEYFSIVASASAGGSIEPEGTFFLTKGDSVELKMDWELNYKPDSLLIDGVFQGPSETYVFRNVSGNHRIEARFTACDGTLLIPYFQVNDDDLTSASKISVVEGDDLKLLVVYEDSSVLTWMSPRGETRSGNEFELENIQIYQAGIYTAYLTNSEGCKNKLDFDISVFPFVLDVYEAEKWIGKSGVLNEICSDAGGGQQVGFINNNDWCIYNIEIEEPGIYDVVGRVATGSEGGEIELSIEDHVLATIPVSNTLSGGWQIWYTTSPVEAEFEKGQKELKLTFKGSEGYLFNLNWFDIIFNRATSTSVSETPIFNGSKNLFTCFSNPDGSGIGINYHLDQTSEVSLQIIDMAGIHTRTLLPAQTQGAGIYNLQWNGENDKGIVVSGGIYLIVFSTKNRREVQKIVFMK